MPTPQELLEQFRTNTNFGNSSNDTFKYFQQANAKPGTKNGLPSAAGSYNTTPATGQDIYSPSTPAFDTTLSSDTAPVVNTSSTGASSALKNTYDQGVGTDQTKQFTTGANATAVPTTSGYKVPTSNPYTAYMNYYPDLMSVWNRGPKNRGMFNNFDNLEDAGAYHYANFGSGEKRINPLNGSDPNAPVAPAPPTIPTAPTGTDAGNTGTGTGAGQTTGNTSANKQSALNQAMARAKLAVAGRGLNWSNYEGLFNPIMNDIYTSIPDTDTNPNAWFDPNMANTILGGEENKQRAGYRQSALGLTNRVDPHALDSTIESILGQSTGTAQQQLDNGLKRGQYNETGYKGGQDALVRAKEAARAKLLGSASDISSKYTDQLRDVDNQALSAASGYQLGDTFDLSPYQAQIQDIMNMYQQGGSGELYNLMGDDPLINLSDMRMAAGTAQGAVNLNDLDVLDALSKRKIANDVGRGLGSQGAF